MQMAVDLKIFDRLAENDGKAVGTAVLAQQTGAERALIRIHSYTVENTIAMES